jgi:hypothetical protein
VPIIRCTDGSGTARFGRLCDDCPLRSRCTDAARGRIISLRRHEKLLARQGARGAEQDWAADYRSTRPELPNPGAESPAVG